MKARYLAAMAVIMFFALPSCLRRELHLPTNEAVMHLTVHDTVPTGIAGKGRYYQMLAYDAASGSLSSMSITGPEGGPVTLRPGPTHIVAARYDSDVVVLTGLERWETLHAYTRSMSTQTTMMFRRLASNVRTKATPLLDEDEDRIWGAFLNTEVAWEPDWFFTARIPDLDVPWRSTDDEPFTFAADAVSTVRPGTITVRGLRGKRNIGSITSFITGLNHGIYLSTGLPDWEQVILAIPMAIGTDDEPSTTVFRTFGFLPSAVAKAKAEAVKGGDIALDDLPETRNILMLLVSDTGGGSYLFTYDITDQCVDADERIVVDILIDLDFDVPEPEKGGGGLQPVMLDWNEVHYIINL